MYEPKPDWEDVPLEELGKAWEAVQSQPNWGDMLNTVSRVRALAAEIRTWIHFPGACEIAALIEATVDGDKDARNKAGLQLAKVEPTDG